MHAGPAAVMGGIKVHVSSLERLIRCSGESAHAVKCPLIRFYKATRPVCIADAEGTRRIISLESRIQSDMPETNTTSFQWDGTEEVEAIVAYSTSTGQN